MREIWLLIACTPLQVYALSILEALQSLHILSICVPGGVCRTLHRMLIGWHCCFGLFVFGAALCGRVHQHPAITASSLRGA